MRTRVADCCTTIFKEEVSMIARRTLFGVVAASLLAFAFGTAYAAYPERPITLIVPWGAGGGTDATARIIGALMEKEWFVSRNCG
jgi:tripartite-type tricarboxylate transporter receptor subunit TctC